MERCAVIGGGIGGLTAAAYLAHGGLEVDLFEQEQRTGGKAADRSFEGFRFDGGPTLLTMPFVLDLLAGEMGLPEDATPKIRGLDETCRYFYGDGTVFRAYADKPRLYEEIKKVMTDPPAVMSDYLSYAKRIYDLCSGLFLFSSFHEFDQLMEHRNDMKPSQVLSLDPFRTMHRANRSFFKDPRLLQYADRYATYNGSNPFRVPATLNIIHHVEQLGASVPEGGIAALPAFLEKAAVSKGVRIYRGMKVRGIEIEKSSVRALRIGDERIPYRRVVSNVDVSTTYRELLEKGCSPGALKYRLLEPSSSALVFYWGMKIREDRLTVHNILFSTNYRKEFRDLFTFKRFPQDPSVYIYISSKFREADAPEGHENWYVMINAPSIRNQNWDKEIAEARRRIIDTLKKTLDIDVEKHLTAEEVFTPEDIAVRTGSHRGSLYGISSNSMMSAFLRQGNRSRAYRGLYFTGGSAHPGGGIPLAMLSGRITARLIEKGLSEARR